MTKVNFPVQTEGAEANEAQEPEPENRTDPFRFTPKLDVLALDPVPVPTAEGGEFTNAIATSPCSASASVSGQSAA